MFRKDLLVFLYLLIMPVNAEDKTLLVLGDSLSAGYGMAVQQGWVYLLQKRLDAQGYPYKVVNASISGDTSRGASSRLDTLLSENEPDITIIELGGNDGLRGISTEEMYNNLSSIITRFYNLGSRILLIPMQLPPNYGPVYNENFEGVYVALSQEHNIEIGRFILQGIGDKTELMQEDGIHPKAEAQLMMLDNVWLDLQPLL